MTAPRPIPAAGGVVWRGERAAPEVAVVHRPRYDDWTLPKGKLHAGENELRCAVREVAEEVGSTVAVSRRLRSVRYDVEGAPKTVSYWTMRHLGGEFDPDDEVDALKWLAPDAAAQVLSYDMDRTVLDDFRAVPVPDAVVVLVRHARAGRRADWAGPDPLRPLDGVGRSQAGELVSFLPAFAPRRIVAAPPVRCVETVAPAAESLGLPLEIDAVFGDDAYVASPAATQDALLALAAPGTVTVVCSQGVTIPALVERFGPGVVSGETRKGAAWVLSFADGAVVSADAYPDATRRPAGRS